MEAAPQVDQNLWDLIQPPPRVGEMTVGPRKAGLAWWRSDDREPSAGPR